jgi:hypothetical protein
MNPPKSPTPRTDKEEWTAGCGPDSETVVWSDFARTLERELAAAKAECYLHRNRLASIFWSGAIDKRTCREVQQWDDDYTAELARLRAEVERLKGALALGQQNCDEAYDDLREEREEAIARAEKAEAALAAMKGTP